jgi:FixJ family two-component response regulator
MDLISNDGEELFDGLNFLQKPYHPRLLAETVRNCLDSAAKERREEALATQTD